MQNQNLEPLTMTVTEVAAALKISRGLAYAAAREGTLPTLRVGRRLLVSRQALQLLLERPERLQTVKSRNK